MITPLPLTTRNTSTEKSLADNLFKRQRARAGLDEKREEVKDESQQQKALGGEERETKSDETGGVKRGQDVGVFPCFTMQFPKVILHIDYCVGIHVLWLSLTNNSLRLGFHWMKM